MRMIRQKVIVVVQQGHPVHAEVIDAVTAAARPHRGRNSRSGKRRIDMPHGSTTSTAAGCRGEAMTGMVGAGDATVTLSIAQGAMMLGIVTE